MKNFHLPLPDHIYAGLRAEAQRARRPATKLARHAIESWLRQSRKAARHRAISSFAAECAGTSLDLDPRLESATVELLADLEEGEN